MGNSTSTDNQLSFEDIQILNQKHDTTMINTLHPTEQGCLIRGTIRLEGEEKVINDLLQSDTRRLIIVYGKNCNDDSVARRHAQLVSLGFQRVFIYRGGMFEWLCLQDIYGNDEFPTTSREIDLLKYKPISMFGGGGGGGRRIMDG